jgi:hypothetical protein
MPSGKKAWFKFLKAVEAAPPGSQFEVGDTWVKGHGWRPYQRIGDKVLMCTPDQARKIVSIYEDMGKRPEWQRGWAEMKDMFLELRAAADDCDRKNRERIIPPDAAEHLPAEGRA